MICEVRGVFPTVPNNARSVRGRQRAATGGTAAGLTRTHSHTHSREHTRSLQIRRQTGTLAPHALPGHCHPHPHICIFALKKSVNKASMAPNEAFLSDFFGSIKQTVASFD
jgi:hypothetical protein